MDMITRNMNNIKNNVISIVVNIQNMKDTREDTRLYQATFFTRSEIQADGLHLSRSNLTSYALNIYGALRFFSSDDQGFRRRQCGGERLVYRGGTINPESSDQTDLKEWCICNLQGGGEPTFEGEDDMWAQGAGWHAGGASLLPSTAMCCFLVSSRVF
jgi:hypothetical protein